MLFGFSGPSGVGKTTAADYLITRRAFERVRFAGPLKAMVRALIRPYGDADEWVDGVLKETVHPILGQTPRHVMQTLGTEWGRQCMGADFWCDLARSELSRGGDIVIDDVRFQNEVDLIRELGGTVVQIRPKVMTHRTAVHASEKGCDFDRFIYNDGTVDQLHHSLELMLMSK